MAKPKIKPFDELTIQDNFMFYELMQNEGLCKKVLQTILGERIGNIIALNRQEIIDNSYGAKGVRLDVLVKDDEKKLYNVEMQMSNDSSLVYRLRYYQGSLDITALDKGQDYDELPDTIIIFLCNGDMLGRGLPICTIQKYCTEDGTIVDDGTKQIVLNYSLYDLIEDKELKALCRYCKTKEVSSELTREIDMEVNRIKQNEKARQEYSFLFNRYPDYIQKAMKEGEKRGINKGISKGITQGRIEGCKDTAKNLLAMGLSVADIAKATGLTEEEITSLVT